MPTYYFNGANNKVLDGTAEKPGSKVIIEQEYVPARTNQMWCLDEHNVICTPNKLYPVICKGMFDNMA